MLPFKNDKHCKHKSSKKLFSKISKKSLFRHYIINSTTLLGTTKGYFYIICQIISMLK